VESAIPPDEEEMLDGLVGADFESDDDLPLVDPESPAPTASQAAPPEDPRFDELSARQQALDDANREIRAENAVLRTQLAVRQQAPPQPDPEDALPDDETFRSLAKEKPVDAIARVVQGILRKTLREERGYVDARLAGQTQAERIRQRVLTEFPEILTNKDLQQEAESLYAELGSGGGNRPMDMYSAVASAHSRLVRSGRLQLDRGAASQAPAAEAGGGLRERVLRTVPAPSDGSGPAASAGAATTPFERDFSDSRQQAAVRKTCKQLGISVDAFKKNYNEMKKADPYYGTGR
jgi:hypothetical protein